MSDVVEADAVEDSVFSRDVAGHTVVHHWNRNSVYRPSSLCGQGTHRPWPEKTDICCWHCTEPFNNPPIGIPLQLKSDGKVVCDGNFCGYSCALTYIFDSGSSHREFKCKQLLTQVARDLHGVIDIVPAPPRLSLTKFGGPLTIESFRRTTTVHKLVVNPPFVSQDIVYEDVRDGTSEPEEQSEQPTLVLQGHGTEDHTDQWSVRGLHPPDKVLSDNEVLSESEPLGQDMYTDFVSENQEQSAVAPASNRNAFGGDLNRFITKKA